uniref:Uncharacterized protein n=1 Tax=Mesocestoides corti TaxID=53468 RepID=A0A5K3EXM2_MESCO
MSDALSVIDSLNQVTTFLVRCGILFGITDHVFDLILAKTATRLNHNLLLFSSTLVTSRNIHDSVGINIESDFDLRHAAGRRRDTNKRKTAEQFVVSCHLALTLKNFDFHLGLSIGCGRDQSFNSK